MTAPAPTSTEGQLFLCLFAGQGYDLRSLLRGTSGSGDNGGMDDAHIASAIAAIWQGRSDRYSELRRLGRRRRPGLRRVEMSYIGG